LIRTSSQVSTRRTRFRQAVARGIGACLIAGLTWVSPIAAMGAAYELEGQQWKALPAPAPNSPEGKLETIRRLLAEDKPGEAKRLADAWIEQHRYHPLEVEALLLRGDALSAQGRYYLALFEYEALIRLYPASQQFMTALEREYEIARPYTSGMKRLLWGVRFVPAGAEGEEMLIRIQERAPGSEIGERASLTLADYYFNNSQMKLAAEAYDLFMLNYPQSEHRPWAMLRLVRANLATFKGPGFDPTGLLEARQRLRLYQAEYPASSAQTGIDALLVRIEESLAGHDLKTAGWYEQRGELVSAAYLYRRLIEQYPQTSADRKAGDKIKMLGVPYDPEAMLLGIDPSSGTDETQGSSDDNLDTDR